MKSYATPDFWRLYGDCPRERRRAQEAFKRFEADPFGGGLEFKRVSQTREISSARISDNYRVLGRRGTDGMAWYWIGSHADYDIELKRIR